MSASVICNVDDARGHSKRAQVQEKCAAFYRDKVLAVHKVLLDQGRNLVNGHMHLGRRLPHVLRVPESCLGR